MRVWPLGQPPARADPNTSTSLAISTEHVGDAEANVVGEVLASLKGNPTAAEEAFGSLNDEQLRAVVASSIDETVTYTGHSVSVMRELAYNQETAFGTAFATYAKQLLNTDQADVLGEQMARLQMGNSLNEEPIARFETSVNRPNGATVYENSGTLGYFVGSVYSATESISSDIKSQQELVTAVLKSALTVIDKTKVGGPAVGTVASVGKEWVSFAVKAAIDDPGTSAAQQLERASIPVDPSNGEIAVGTNSFSSFNDRVSQIRRLD